MKQHYKTIWSSLLAVLLGGIVSSSAFADTATVDADATVQAVVPLVFTQTAPLSWGTFTVGATGGVIYVGSADAPSVLSGNITAVSGGTTGRYTISGQAGQQISILIDGTATLSDGSNTMTAELRSGINFPTLDSTLGLPANFTDTLV